METLEETVDRLTADADKITFEVLHRIADLAVAHEVTIQAEE
jgi:hypothetical protein